MATINGQFQHDHASPPDDPDSDRFMNAELAVEWSLKESLNKSRRLDFEEGPDADREIEARLALVIVADGTEAEQIAEHLKALLASVEREKGCA